MISSAQRLRWMASTESACTNSDREVAVARRIHAVGCRRGEAKFARSNGSIERKRRSGDRARAERSNSSARFGNRRDGRLSRSDHLDVSKQPMRHQHRLRALQMRVGRHGGASPVFRAL